MSCAETPIYMAQCMSKINAVGCLYNKLFIFCNNLAEM